MSRLFLSVHETSADLASAELVGALQRLVAEPLDVVGLGGPRCEAAGVDLWRETTQHALHGIVEVAGEVPRVLRDIRDTAERVAAWRPDVCVLVDAPDYNIRLAKRLRRLLPGVPVVYFLCPQIWAWRIGRISQLRRYFDKRLCIAPFEPSWYRQYYTDAEYIGHPAQDRIAAYLDEVGHDRAAVRTRLGLDADEHVVAVLPGSRGKEIRGMLPRQLAALAQFNRTRKPSEPRLRPVVAAAPMREPQEYAPTLEAFAALEPLLVHPTDAGAQRGTSYDAVYAADAALVCSGTASLETALLGCPQVVGYRLHWLTGLIGEILVQVRYASLVNLVLGREAVPERLQRNCTVDKLADALVKIHEPATAARIQADYAELYRKLGPPGAATRAAESIAATYLGDAPSNQTAHTATAHTTGWVRIREPLR